MADDNTPNVIPDRYCEICDAPATTGVRDSRQVTEPDDDGYCVWRPDGPWRFYCEEHKRLPRDLLLDGTVVLKD